jgi:hypothetical protein
MRRSRYSAAHLFIDGVGQCWVARVPEGATSHMYGGAPAPAFFVVELASNGMPYGRPCNECVKHVKKVT